MLNGQKVKITYQGQEAIGVVLKSILTATIETNSNPVAEKVLLHKVKLDNPLTVLWDEVQKVVSVLLVDNVNVEVLS